MPTTFTPNPKIKELEQIFLTKLASLDNVTQPEEKSSAEKFDRDKYLPTSESKFNLLLHNFYSSLIEIIEISQNAKKTKDKPKQYIENHVKKLYVYLNKIQATHQVWKYILKEQAGRDALYYIFLINMIYISFSSPDYKNVLSALKKDASAVELHILALLEDIRSVEIPRQYEQLSTSQKQNPFMQAHAYCQHISPALNLDELEESKVSDCKVLKSLIQLLEHNNAAALFYQVTDFTDDIPSFIANIQKLASKGFLPKSLLTITGNELKTVFKYISTLYIEVHSFRTRHALAFERPVYILNKQYEALLQLSLCFFGRMKNNFDPQNMLIKLLTKNLVYLKKKNNFLVEDHEFVYFWRAIAKINLNSAEETNANKIQHKALLAALNFIIDFSMTDKKLSQTERLQHFKNILDTLDSEEYNFKSLASIFVKINYPEIIDTLNIKIITFTYLAKDEIMHFFDKEPELLNKFQKKITKVIRKAGLNLKIMSQINSMLMLKQKITSKEEIFFPAKNPEDKKITITATFKPHSLYTHSLEILESYFDALDDNIRNLKSTPPELKEYKRDQSLVDQLDDSNKILLRIIENIIDIIKKSQNKNGKDINDNMIIQKLVYLLFQEDKYLWRQFLNNPKACRALSYLKFIDVIHIPNVSDKSYPWEKDFLKTVFNENAYDVMEFIDFMGGSRKEEVEKSPPDSIPFIKNKILKLFLILKNYDPFNIIMMNELEELLKSSLLFSPNISSFNTQLLQIYFSSQLILIMDMYRDDLDPLIKLTKKIDNKGYIIKDLFTKGFTKDNFDTYLFRSTYRVFNFVNIFKKNYTVSDAYPFNFLDEIASSVKIMAIYYINTLTDSKKIKPSIFDNLTQEILNYIKENKFDIADEISSDFWAGIIKLFSLQTTKPYIELVNESIDQLFLQDNEHIANNLLCCHISRSVLNEEPRSYHDALAWLIQITGKLPKGCNNNKFNIHILKIFEIEQKNFIANHINKITQKILDNFRHTSSFLLNKITNAISLLLEQSTYFKTLLTNESTIHSLLDIILRLAEKLGMDAVTWNEYKAKFLTHYNFTHDIKFNELREISEIINEYQALEAKNKSELNNITPRSNIKTIPPICEAKIAANTTPALPPINFLTKLQPIIQKNYLFTSKKNYSIFVKRERLPTSLLKFSNFNHALTEQYLTLIGGAPNAYLRKKDNHINDYDVVLFFGLEALFVLYEKEQHQIHFEFEKRGANFPIIHVILAEEYLCDCTIIRLPLSTQTDFLNYPTTTPAAYIRTKDKLFYVNKINQICNEVKFNESLPSDARVNINMLKAFDRHLPSQSNLRRLTLRELRHITTLTRHTHAKLIDVDVSCYPNYGLYDDMMKNIIKQRDIKRSTLYMHLLDNQEIYALHGFYGATAAAFNDTINAINPDTIFKNKTDLLRIFRIAKALLEEPESKWDINLAATMETTNFNYLFNNFIFKCELQTPEEEKENIKHLRQINTQLHELFNRFNPESVIRILCTLPIISSMTGITDCTSLLNTADEFAEYLNTLSPADKLKGFYLFIDIHFNLSSNSHDKKALLEKFKATLEPHREAPEFQSHLDYIHQHTSTRMRQPKISAFKPDPEFSGFLCNIKMKMKECAFEKEEKKAYRM